VRLGISRRHLLLSSAAALGCGRPKATGFPGFCFVANQVGRSVGVVDLERFRSRPPIRLDAAPSAVLAHPTQPKAYVLAPEAGTVYEIDAGPRIVSRQVRAGNIAAGMQLSPTGDSLWVLYRDPAALLELPLDSLRPRLRIRLTATPDTFELSGANSVAVASTQARTILLASSRTGAIERTIAMGDEPSIVHWQKDGTQLIVGSRSQRSVSIFHAGTGKMVVRLPLPLEPRHFTAKPDGGQIFISGDGMDAVVILYPYRTEVAETMLAGRAPAGMAVTGEPPHLLLVTNPETGTVTVLSFDNMGRKLVGVVQVGQEPRHILITPDQQYALVLNEKSGDLAVVRIRLLKNQDASKLPALRPYRPTPLFTMIPIGEKPVSAAVVEV
jgi:DNA-binding beta-propeller fold protein YncE